MRSCSSSVLVEQTAEQVTAVHLGWVILGAGPGTSWVWRLQMQRPVRAVLVVVLHVDAQDPIQVALPDDQQPVQALDTNCPDPAFCVGVRVRRLHRRQQHLGAFGAEHVVEAAAELRVAVAQQEAHAASLLLQCEQQVAGLLGDPPCVGLAVTPARWTRRVSSSRKNRTYSRLGQMVLTVKKSKARIPAACWHRKARHVVVVRRGAGWSPWRCRVVRMAVAEIRRPSRSSSPLMRW
jgi:hypothetical protein